MVILAATKKVLLAHGWSGRGTQMPLLAAALAKNDYQVISFDAPGHGRAAGKMSMMPFFIEAIHHLESTRGPFHAAIGHSLGGMSLLRAAKEGLNLEKAGNNRYSQQCDPYYLRICKKYEPQ
jgi:pimeloyl-ACP methyl ester carboxylesterase